MTSTTPKNRFLTGPGEMTGLIRSKDWSKTPVGPIGQWPQSLRTTLSNLLASKFPMFLWWGPELTCFYNDAYRPSLGINGKHPAILGRPAREAWAEIWPVIYPLIEQVLSGGESTWSEDQLIPIYRNGRLEDVYWTFSYSPVNDDYDNIAGVLVTCAETTATVLARKRFQKTLLQAPVAICIFRGPAFIIELANDRILELWGKTAGQVLDKKVFEGVPEAAGQGFEEILENVYTRGERFAAEEVPVKLSRNGIPTLVYVNFLYEPLLEDDGSISGIIAVATDVTKSVLAQKQILDAEERNRLAIEGGQLGTFDLDIASGSIITSGRFKEIFGFVDSGIHSDYFSALHPEDRPIQAKAFEKALQTGNLSYDARILWPDDSTHWVQVDGQLFFDDQARPVRQLGTIKDITARKNTEAELKAASEELQLIYDRFRLLTNSMPQIIWTADINGELNYFNQALYAYSGFDAGQIEEQGWMNLIVYPDDRAAQEKNWLASVTTGQDFLFEHRFLRRDGQYRWHLSRAVPQKDDAGNIRMWVGTSTDIHELKMHEQQKDDFIKMASHELKTPLTTIKGYVQLLLQTSAGTNDEFLASSLSTIDRQVSKLTKLIVHLLEVTRIETGNVLLSKALHPIGDIVKDTIRDMQMTTRTHTLLLTENAFAPVFVDKDRIQQVLSNLLANAVKYSPEADKVFVEITGNEKEVVITVRDLGIGITKEDQPKIFERFYRVEGKDEKTFPGFGIGLFIVNEILSLHNGRIWVESEKGQGSAFHFSLPVVRA